jgi:ribosome-associated heat shock protein Hsp15
VKDDDQGATPAPATVRLDRWLSAARFFKTRSLAQGAVEGGHVKLNGERVKPARAVRVGDRLEIRIGAYEWRIKVEALSVRRGPAAAARLLYEESEESRLARQERVSEKRTERGLSTALQGRPTKRNRRQLDRLTDGD